MTEPFLGSDITREPRRRVLLVRGACGGDWHRWGVVLLAMTVSERVCFDGVYDFVGGGGGSDSWGGVSCGAVEFPTAFVIF